MPIDNCIDLSRSVIRLNLPMTVSKRSQFICVVRNESSCHCRK
jgi:hypothetical protein